jgi:hypothetical protein
MNRDGRRPWLVGSLKTDDKLLVCYSRAPFAKADQLSSAVQRQRRKSLQMQAFPFPTGSNVSA